MKNLLFFIFLFIGLDAVAQKRDYHAEIKQYQDSINKNFPKNTIYLELLGSDGLYSINYDRIFYQHKRLKFSYRLGATMFPFTYQEIIDNIGSSKIMNSYGGLSSFNVIHGRKNRFVEFGLGYTIGFAPKQVLVKQNPLTLIYEMKPENTFLLHLSYRRQSKKGLFFQVSAIVFKKIGIQSYSTKNALNGVKGTPSWLWTIGIGVGVGKSF